MDYKKILNKSWKIGILVGIFSVIMIEIFDELKLTFTIVFQKAKIVIYLITFLVYFLYGTFMGFILLNTIKNYKKSSTLINILKLVLIVLLLFGLMWGVRVIISMYSIQWASPF